MRFKELFIFTAKELPAEAQAASHRLLLRGGYIHQAAAGIFSYLPLARRVMNKIQQVMHREMQKIGGQEITMPVVLPADIWKQTGRFYDIGSEMSRFKDRKDHDMVLAMTHEEALGDLARKVIRSYRQLPALVYHIQTKWRDDPRPRAGLIRVREFTMKDSYSLDADWEGLDRQYRAHYQAYFNIFHSCGIDVLAVKSDTGMMGGKMAHEFMYLTPVGEDTIILCPSCGYHSNRQVAEFKKVPLPAEEPAAPVKIATPGKKTIADLGDFLSLSPEKFAKAVFMTARVVKPDHTEESLLVTAVLRGDMELNETKLANAVRAKELRPALDEEIIACGGVPGYASPRGMKNTLVVADDLIPQSGPLVCGANEEGFHLTGAVYGRDFSAEIVTDIAAAGAGSLCPVCGAPLLAEKAVEVGNIFKLGTRYSEALGCTFQDQEGRQQPIIMGSYGIGVGRLLSCVVEQHHDEGGIIWPITIAPFQVHLTVLGDKTSPEPAEGGEELYRALQEAGVETLLDDRQESPGVKFADADLLGIPIRLTVSRRSLTQGGVEVKLRREEGRSFVSPGETVGKVRELIAALTQEIEARVRPVEYRE
ncbi:MAG: proline--tRNA ligase [Spirochaetales bacterium]|jgi:prolyl-tRNA synthetase|nr:proline--tRNA ligase [Spirochaetales bacterium]